MEHFLLVKRGEGHVTIIDVIYVVVELRNEECNVLWFVGREGEMEIFYFHICTLYIHNIDGSIGRDIWSIRRTLDKSSKNRCCNCDLYSSKYGTQPVGFLYDNLQ